MSPKCLGTSNHKLKEETEAKQAADKRLLEATNAKEKALKKSKDISEKTKKAEREYQSTVKTVRC